MASIELSSLSARYPFPLERRPNAASWCMPEIRELMNDGRVHLVQGPMCHSRLASTGDGNEEVCVEKRDGQRAARGW